MARVKAKQWLGVVAGLALPAAGVGMAEGLAAVPATAARGADLRVCQNLPRSRASTALNDGIDNYLKGDYAAAAQSFKQAQASFNDLAPDQQQDLKKFGQLNDTALQHRAEAAELVRQAEKAEHEGRALAAAELAQRALGNQKAAPADKQKAQQIVARVRGTPAGATTAGNTSAVGKGKLDRARKLLAEGNLDAAEQLAREADRAGAGAGPGEESPKSLLEEIAHTRQDPALLLNLARTALARGDLDRAEALARASKKAEPIYSVHLWGDSPSKVLDEVQAARTAKKQQPDKAVVKKPGATDDFPTTDFPKGTAAVKKSDALPSAPDGQKAGQAAEQARQLMQQGRKALKDGQIDKADECARKADALKPSLGWWEDDTPAKLMADVQAARAARGGTAKAADARAMPADPRALLHQAHQAFDAGKFDESLALAQRAKIAPGAKDAWGLFDRDTPDNLIKEVNKARTKYNQEEAARLLVEGRKLLDQAEHDEARRGELLDSAQKLALKADALRNGNYSVWEMGDRPSKLLADIDDARKKGRITVVPPVPPAGAAVGSNDGAGRWPAGEPDEPRVQKARHLMNEARAAARAGNPAAAVSLINNVEQMNLPADKLGSDSPAAVRRELAAVAGGAPVRPPTPAAPPDRAGSGQARALVAEARQLQGQGRLLEARARLLEAQRLPAVFGADEDRPEKALLELAGAARRQIDHLEAQADDAVHRGAADPQKYAGAEELLGQAQALAHGFQLDTYLLEKKLAWVRQTRGSVAESSNPGGGVQRVGARANVNDGGPQAQGQRLLDQARMEIRAGNTGAARRLVEQVYAGNFGLRTDAENLLRNIDVEEYEQKRREQQRTFDAADSAFKRGDYPIAGRLLRVIDAKVLTEKQQVRMRELMLLPEMQPERAAPELVAQAAASGPGAGSAPATQNVNDGGDSRGADYLKQVEGLREIKFQKMRDQEFKAERDARKLADTGDTGRAVEVLQEYLSQLPESGLDPDKSALLRRPVEAKLQQYRTLDAQKKFNDAQVSLVTQAKYNHSTKVLAEENKQHKIKELMDKYNALYKQAKYREAEMYAMQAQELDPDNPVAAAAVQISRMQSNVVRYRGIKEKSEAAFLEYADQAQDMGQVVSPDDPLKFDKGRTDIARKRKPFELKGISGLKSPKDREIEHRLDGYVNLNFNNVPLGKVLDELSTMHEINVLPDLRALNEAGISLSEPLTFKVDNMTLRSALKNLLSNINLTYVIEDEALKITTPNNARGKMLLVPYQVTELVIPIPDGVGGSTLPNNSANPLAQAQSANSTPVTTPMALTNGTPTGSSGGSAFGTAGSPTGGDWRKSVSPTREDQLIQLIQNTVSPKSWASMGGQGTIDYFPMTMTLVINQTPDIQEQIGDLLAALRRLQDAEVAVEIRLISIAEGFFERIGVDFNINIVNDKGTQKFQPQITSGQFKPAGFINDFTPNHFLSGLTPAGTFTSDLGIPITTSSYGMAIPPFGGFPNIPGGNGGIDLGLAFLSDIQVYMFLEAAQGDQRTNVMQAPKLTLFNGQLATLTVSDQQFFVTSGSVFVVNGSPVFVPNNQLFPTGVTINVQAVISADRRFVRLNFSGVDPLTGRPGISITNLASATVPLFPIVQLVPTVLDGGIQTSPVAFTQFFQQPVFNTVSVVTTVAVPDGGTVLLGGLKRLSEGRNEFGPPVLSKIPYLDRLFRNVGYGREVENLMMMVTPRIIINEEEELRQTGVGFGPAAEGR